MKFPETVISDDGSHTLRHPRLGDTYHSTRGAVGEAQHVFIDAGFNHIPGPEKRIFEMGFGSGLNALLTLKKAVETGCRVTYHAVEIDPVPMEVIRQLNYLAADDPLYPAFLAMHETAWGCSEKIHPAFTLKKNAGSLLSIELDVTFEIVYFDAFAPETQPELWSEAVFRKLREAVVPDGVLVTYSAKGDVKRTLRAAGWEVERLPGALGKRHMVRATKR
ncbi:MAG: tRNA (5-methylaminomethyl-2-thiouridine)(34)-methyltransferase MnmD [Rikenellaceae bacterium]|jgi:tRNA U34 5-methylaminomethyl-2-thiouridine-forming methyltransferase MnmC|nr:tRNA (5-methylaminomethyl-2-thiouridine)(34)-methyltransferase MnmD [Rikenellaceae bacterium]